MSRYLLPLMAGLMLASSLALADEPIPGDVCDGGTTPLELEKLYSGLQSGRWLIVAGERRRHEIPLAEDICSVNLAERKIVVRAPEGLLDL